MLKSTYFIFYTELLLLLRYSQEWLYPLGFFSIVLILFPLALTPDATLLTRIAPGCIWITALLANLLTIQTLFSADMEEGYLEQWLVSSLPLTLFIFIKFTAHWLVTMLPLIVLTAIFGVVFNLSFTINLILCLSLLVGTPILTLVGCLMVSLTLGLRQHGVLLGLLIFPIVIPVLIFGVAIVAQAQAGFSIVGPLAFLGGISLLAVIILPFVIASTLRISLDG